MSSPTRYNAQLQERDILFLKGLFESRLMTLSQAAAIHFSGNLEAAKKRLQKLKSSGYIAQRPRRQYDPSIVSLTNKAFTALAEGGYLDAYPPLAWTNMAKRAQVSDLTLRHELAVMDFKAAMYLASRERPNLHIAEFSTWPLLYEFEAKPGNGTRTMAVRPDGYIRIHEDESDGSVSEHVFFLELDRSTEVLDTLVTRCLCYRDWYLRGGLAVRHGRPRTEYENFPFRVLVIVRNDERRNNLAARLLLVKPPILSQVWLSTSTECLCAPLGAVWIRTQDYRRAVAGSGFTTNNGGDAGYRRNSEREEHVDRKISKLSFLSTGS